MSSAWEPVLQYGVPAVAVVASAIISGWYSHRSQRKAHEVSERTAQATIDDTFTRAYQAADKHWALYNEAMQRRCDDLDEQVTKNAKAIEDANLRFLEADERAQASDKLYRKAIIYLRKLLIWINTTLPGENYPLPPPELDLDL